MHAWIRQWADLSAPGRAGLQIMDQLWANRAASAEAAIAKRQPSNDFGSCPAPSSEWSAGRPPAVTRPTGHGTTGGRHTLLDCLVDAQLRDPPAPRLTSISRQIRGHRIRNNGRWTNSYYDDMAWLALALERAGRLAGVERERALKTLSEQFVEVLGPRGRWRNPLAQAGSVLQRARQRSGRIFLRARRPVCAAPSRWPTGSTRR